MSGIRFNTEGLTPAQIYDLCERAGRKGMRSNMTAETLTRILNDEPKVLPAAAPSKSRARSAPPAAPAPAPATPAAAPAEAIVMQAVMPRGRGRGRGRGTPPPATQFLS